jgi:hypothetical protein
MAVPQPRTWPQQRLRRPTQLLLSRLLLPRTPQRQLSLMRQRVLSKPKRPLQRAPSTGARHSMPNCMRTRPRNTMKSQPHTPRRSKLSYSLRRSTLKLQSLIIRVWRNRLSRLQQKLLKLLRLNRLPKKELEAGKFIMHHFDIKCFACVFVITRLADTGELVPLRYAYTMLSLHY